MDETAKHLLDVDSLCNHIGYGVNLLLAVQTAMAEGPYSEAEFTGALYVVFDYLCDMR